MMEKNEKLNMIKEELKLWIQESSARLDSCIPVAQMLMMADKCPLKICRTCKQSTTCKFFTSCEGKNNISPENNWEEHIRLATLFKVLQFINDTLED